ncbi:MAG: rhomboid family intramembrane serine protease [Acidimicrobiales bacterium]
MLPLKDRNPTRQVPVVTIALIIINVGVFLFVQPQGRQLLGQVGFNDMESVATRFNFEYAAIPCEVVQGRPLTVEELPHGPSGDTCREGAPGPPVFPGKQVWLAVLFSMFLHGGLLHLGGNMLFLWVFGNNIEDHVGPVRYVLFYLAAGLVATGAHVVVQPDSTIPLVGASGAIAGVMGAYLVWFPNAPVLTLFIFIIILFREIEAKWLLGFWLLSQFFVNPNAGVAWVAHVGGFVFGVLVALAVRASRSIRQVAWRGGYADPARDPWGEWGRGPY